MKLKMQPVYTLIVECAAIGIADEKSGEVGETICCRQFRNFG